MEKVLKIGLLNYKFTIPGFFLADGESYVTPAALTDGQQSELFDTDIPVPGSGLFLVTLAIGANKKNYMILPASFFEGVNGVSGVLQVDGTTVGITGADANHDTFPVANDIDFLLGKTTVADGNTIVIGATAFGSVIGITIQEISPGGIEIEEIAAI